MDHEYSVLGGVNRATVGRYLSIAASVIAALIGAAVVFFVEIAKKYGFNEYIPGLVLWPLTAGFIYTVLYWWFESAAWKWPKLSSLLKVPNIAGTWECSGQSRFSDGTTGEVWNGEIKINQSWDKLRVTLKTKRAGSTSIAAALVSDQAGGFRLLYNYKNDPNIDEPLLIAHRGAAELVFSEDLNSAEGSYFNGYGHYTFGVMKLKRK